MTTYEKVTHENFQELLDLSYKSPNYKVTIGGVEFSYDFLQDMYNLHGSRSRTINQINNIISNISHRTNPTTPLPMY